HADTIGTDAGARSLRNGPLGSSAQRSGERTVEDAATGGSCSDASRYSRGRPRRVVRTELGFSIECRHSGPPRSQPRVCARTPADDFRSRCELLCQPGGVWTLVGLGLVVVAPVAMACPWKHHEPLAAFAVLALRSAQMFCW